MCVIIRIWKYLLLGMFGNQYSCGFIVLFDNQYMQTNVAQCDTKSVVGKGFIFQIIIYLKMSGPQGRCNRILLCIFHYKSSHYMVPSTYLENIWAACQQCYHTLFDAVGLVSFWAVLWMNYLFLKQPDCSACKITLKIVCSNSRYFIILLVALANWYWKFLIFCFIFII